jgi:YHS domain-containing protein
MLGFVLDVLFALAVLRAIWRLVQGIKVGMSVGTADPGGARERGGPPAQGVHMVKDPVCGTYVVPNPALSTSVGRRTMYFCSAACRDKYAAKTA